MNLQHAVAATGRHMPHDLSPPPHGLFGPMVAFGSAALGAFGLWLANRMLGKAAFQTAINAGFRDLTDQLQEERTALRAEIEKERLSFAVERSSLRGEIRLLRQVVGTLINTMRAGGMEVPAMPISADQLDDIIELKGPAE